MAATAMATAVGKRSLRIMGRSGLRCKSAGTSMANHLAMAAILEPGDEVLIEHPAYGPILDIAHYLK